MSIAEFYIEHGIDPSDPNHMDDFLNRIRYEYEEEEEEEEPQELCTGLAIVERLQRDSTSRTAESSWPLNESELDYMAETRGREKIDGLPPNPPMSSYRNSEGDIRLNFWLSTGTVGSYLEHPRQGKTQLFRREIDMSMASDIFNNPRQHTGKGYHTTDKTVKAHSASKNRKSSNDRSSAYMRTCGQCKKLKPNCEYSKNQRNKGRSARCRGCVC